MENSASLVGEKLTHPFPPHAPNLHTHTEYTLTHTLTHRKCTLTPSSFSRQ